MLSHIHKKIVLTENEEKTLVTFFNLKSLKKKQLVLQEGGISDSISFVATGLLRSYTMNEKGNEHISLFAWEGWWISNFNSFICGGEAKLNIDAIEDSTLLQLTRENYEKMLEAIPAMEKYFRILYQNSLTTKDTRLISANTHTAEEKYIHFLESYPNLIKRLPQNLIASYLGITPETISRIKKKIND
ncbi:Crp/Fnr family transcriptional regulator [Flavobacterium agricola]|uniref:Crp/Fnr family transcriptional regulator n=1 Tax=Flavobacterium agricola TaxID=2870839 RepID=UPI002223CCFB|nr:Crp/Fnr family transcriptional regulator [Flavobacterium agricola]